MQKVFSAIEKVRGFFQVDLAKAGVAKGGQVAKDEIPAGKPMEQTEVIARTGHHDIVGEPGGKWAVRGRQG